MYRFLILIAVWLSWATPAWALDHLVVRRNGREFEVTGRIVLTAGDGGVLLMARDGVLWTIQPDEKVRESSDDTPFKPMSSQELAQSLLRELPKGFDIQSTTHYLICFNTSRAYAEWCGSLFEQLYRAFTNYWSRKGFDLQEPEFPLVAIVFVDKQSYTSFAQAEVGDAVKSLIGYFSLQTNRMVMYDLTGVEATGHGARGVASVQSRILAQPGAEQTVATIVHEATHQIAFNCGLHTRFSDCPLWFSEGIAMYFETPDLRGSKAWRSIGAINEPRVIQLRQYLQHRPSDSLTTLISDDKRFRDPKQGLDAYAEAWALTYYLMNKYPKQYIAYMRQLSQKTPLIWDDPSQRLAEFRQFFGADLKKFDADFLRYLQRLR